MGRPKLRRLERATLRRAGEELLVLRDPLELSEPVAIDTRFAPVLDALDGERTLAQVRQSLRFRGLVEVDADDLDEFVREIGEAGLLDDDRFRELWARAHDEFVEQPTRAARRAGLLYPDTPDELRTWLAPVLPPRRPASAAEEATPSWGGPTIAVLAPHQPPVALPELVRPLLASLGDPRAIERVIVLATDHSPGLLPYASTDKDWETPLGTVAADLALLAQLDERLPWLLREQIRLRLADPIEWVCVLLRALWGDRCPPIVPLACGQTRLTQHEGRVRADEMLATLSSLLEPSTSDRRTLLWTAAELSHLGPAYGHETLPARDELEVLDRRALDALLTNKPSHLAKRCMDRPASQRPSGTAALVTLAELLPLGYRATLIAHQLLDAPGDLPGLISCAAVRFQAPPQRSN